MAFEIPILSTAEQILADADAELRQIQAVCYTALKGDSFSDKLAAAKTVSIRAAGLVQALKNPLPPETQLQQDMRWLTGQLSRRHPGIGVVWEKASETTIVIGGVRTPLEAAYLRRKTQTDAKDHAAEIQRDMDRRMQLLLHAERVAGLTHSYETFRVSQPE